ncbi:MAG: glucoamylase family protein [Chloroflexota bacterium]
MQRQPKHSRRAAVYQDELHGELFSLERLEEYGREVAAVHKAATRRVPAKPLVGRVEKSGRSLEEAYTRLAKASSQQQPLMPGDEWLLDNYHIVRDSVDEIRVDLPRGYYLRLPRLAVGLYAGYPRVYAAVRELILHTDGIVDDGNIEAFLRGYQSTLPLDIGELWTVPTMIRLALAENLARLAQMLVSTRRQLEAANTWADRLLTSPEPQSPVAGVPLRPPPELEREVEQLTRTFVVRLLQRLREGGPAVAPVLEWLEVELARAGSSPEEAVRAEFAGHSAVQVSVGNTISSMRVVLATDWADFVERHSAIEALLRTDPAGVYSTMDFATRDRYRHVVERVSRRSGKPEIAVTQRALQLAHDSKEAEPDDPRRSHVGYYLVARGVHQLRAATGYRSRLGETLSRFIRAYPTSVYVGSILAITAVGLMAALLFGFGGGGQWGSNTLWTVAAILLAALPASELAVRLVNLIVTLLLPPRVLPKLDFSEGIPAEHSTFVVIPTLFKNSEEVRSLVEHIEVLYLANQDPNLRFAILSDFADAPQEEMPGDAEVVQVACAAVEHLNSVYGDDRFYLFHRKRQWNPKEGPGGKGIWMGWERKRGKLSDFNALLRGRGGASFVTRVGDLVPITATRYVITLDTDTDLPRDAARRLVGTLAHPNNRAEIDLRTGTVTTGYGILQPNVETTWDSAGKTPFSRLFSGHTGIDPYTTAVSDAYQDLFGEGIFIGKGIYDVDIFEETTKGSFPKNAILSHDLLEGTYARVGLVSDVVLYDDIPSRYDAYAARAHRWTRGDWQISPWVFHRVPSEKGKVRNTITPVNRWKIADNLRRSLVAPASILLLLAGWLAPSLSPLFWTLFVLLVIAFPFYSHLLTATPRKPEATPWSRHLGVVFADAFTNLLHLFLTITFLPHTAYLMLDAVVRTLVRMNITHRHLLEWVTSSEAQRSSGRTPLDFLKRMWQAAVFSALLAVALAIWSPASLFVAGPFLVLWLLSPLIAYLVSKPPVPEVYTLTEADRAYIRRVARKSWRYFEEFVGTHEAGEELWLAPDNFQEDPKGVLAHRTSPTNLGLLVLSTLSAYDLGYVTLSGFAERTGRTLSSMEGLERYNGHFYNWYDTRSGHALPPKYISTVDSGNLAGHLLALKGGCNELLNAPLFSPQLVENVRDLAGLILSQLEVLGDDRRGSLHDAQQSRLGTIRERVVSIGAEVKSTPRTAREWIALAGSLVHLTEGLATEARSLVGARGWQNSVLGRGAEQGAAERQYSSVDELVHWTGSLARAAEALNAEVSHFLPWSGILEAAPALFVGGGHQSLGDDAAALWAGLVQLPDSVPSLNDTVEWCTAHMHDIERLQALIKGAGLGEEGNFALAWLEQFGRWVAGAWAASETLSSRLKSLAASADSMVREMKFGFLYDVQRKLFTIGYNVTELRRDNSYYDLLASEARLASYLAIANGEVPQAHWFRMGRPVTGAGRDQTLIAWTGTMFEYLMPNLVMPTYKGSLLDQTCTGAVRHHERYTRSRNVPWGISESAYNALDSEQNYRYRAFGLPDLGLKRGLSEDLVVAPYATQLAIGVDPKQALENLRRLSSIGMEGRYGFYDAIDFTRSRLTPGQSGAIVRTFMVHHLGMGLVAMNNVLNGDPMVRRFEAEPEVRATLLLLQERVPRQAQATKPHPIAAEREQARHEDLPPVVRTYSTPNTDVPRVHLISNGRYTVMMTNSGAGYSRWKSGGDTIAVTRWRDDWVRDPWGTFIYLRDMGSGTVWSAAAAPFDGEPSGYRAHFAPDRAEYLRSEGDIETHMEVVVSPEDDAEIRRVTLTNRGSRAHEIELTSYAEIALATQQADEAHSAFSKLFVETEYLPEHGALLASRRPRSAGEGRMWLTHVVAVSRHDGDTDALGSPFAEEYETDRMAFLGRGGTPAAPRALMTGQRLGNTSGAVLDPIFSLRQVVRVAPGAKVQVTFVTAAAGTREEAHALSDKYHDAAWVERAVVMALSQAQIELRMLDISVDDAMQYQRVFSRMIYPRSATRPSETTLARNTKGQQGLWAYGISGDLPILLVRIADLMEVPLVRQALGAHEFWQRNGFQADLVILNEYPGGYVQPVQDTLEQLVATSHAHQMLNKPGGVFVKRADVMPAADLILLNTVARAVLVGNRGTLDAQLDREVPDAPARQPRRSPQSAPAQPGSKGATRTVLPAREEAGEDHNTLGEFTPDGREYVITLKSGQWTPLPWSNVLTNYHFGCLLTESGLASTWSENSRENRLSPWSNDPVSDPPSEAIYVREEESGSVMSPTLLPLGATGSDAEPYIIRHGQGYTVYQHNSNGIEQTLRVSVPSDDPVKVCKLTLRNSSPNARKLSATYYAELVLGVSRETVARYIITEANRERGAILARNPYNPEFAERVAFAATSAGTFTFTADRAEFLGRNGSMQAPAALKRRDLSGRVGAGLDPCVALQCAIELQPGEERTVVFTLGEGDNLDHARYLAGKYRSLEQVELEYAGTLRMWDWLLSAVVVETPDVGMNMLLNRWALYQSISCRLWGRTAFYQSGGAYGFRDQLQDVMALMYAAPNLAREQIVRCEERQFVEGDVQHWWHPPTGRGVRTRFSDDLLWLPFVTAHYIAATGDFGVLDEERPFLQAPLLAPDQEDMYSTPTVSEEVGSLYEHCLRAIKRGVTAGAHGLPLMGSGDWNDGMNRVGIEGKGESVWLGWFLYAVLDKFAPLCEQRGDSEHAAEFRAEMERLKTALHDEAWDGEWYLRAFYDNGTPLGSAQSEECQIDAIAQSWGVISGAADKERAVQAMRSLEERLVKEQEKLILLLTPPFDRTPEDPGYIKGYLPGVRENGGQYTHAAIWVAIAHVLLGDAEGAYRLFGMLNPVSHALTAEGAERYKAEPYVIAADIYSHPQHTGRGGWTWYTGSASWFYRLGVEYMLGLKLRGDHFTLEPCIPAEWPGFSMTLRYKDSHYHISVESGSGTARDVTTVELDGSPLPDCRVPLVDDRNRHEVRVLLGSNERVAPASS